MAFSHGTRARVWLDGFAASCSINDFSIKGDIDTAEVTTLCKSAKNYIPGLEDESSSLSGFYDTDTTTQALALAYFVHARKRTVFPVAYWPQGDTAIAGDQAFFHNGEMTSYKIDTSVKDAASLDLEFQSNTGWRSGVVLLADAARTTTSQSTALDNTALSLLGASAVLSVSAVSGTTPTLVVKVQHSVDNSVWVDLFTFGSKNTVAGEFQETTGTTTIQRYVRAQWTIAGTTPSFTFNVSFHRR